MFAITDEQINHLRDVVGKVDAPTRRAVYEVLDAIVKVRQEGRAPTYGYCSKCPGTWRLIKGGVLTAHRVKHMGGSCDGGRKPPTMLLLYTGYRVYDPKRMQGGIVTMSEHTNMVWVRFDGTDNPVGVKTVDLIREPTTS